MIPLIPGLSTPQSLDVLVEDSYQLSNIFKSNISSRKAKKRQFQFSALQFLPTKTIPWIHNVFSSYNNSLTDIKSGSLFTLSYLPSNEIESKYSPMYQINQECIDILYHTICQTINNNDPNLQIFIMDFGPSFQFNQFWKISAIYNLDLQNYQQFYYYSVASLLEGKTIFQSLIDHFDNINKEAPHKKVMLYILGIGHQFKALDVIVTRFTQKSLTINTSSFSTDHDPISHHWNSIFQNIYKVRRKHLLNKSISSKEIFDYCFVYPLSKLFQTVPLVTFFIAPLLPFPQWKSLFIPKENQLIWNGTIKQAKTALGHQFSHPFAIRTNYWFLFQPQVRPVWKYCQIFPTNTQFVELKKLKKKK